MAGRKRPRRAVGAAAICEAAAQGHRYLYLSRASWANLVGLMPHFFSRSWMKPDLCHSVAVFDIMSANPFSPCLTARPHGTNRIESSGISYALHSGFCISPTIAVSSYAKATQLPFRSDEHTSELQSL